MTGSLRKLYVLLLTALMLMTACSKGPDVPFASVDFTLEDLFTGDEIQLAAYHGRPVLLYFFASW